MPFYSNTVTLITLRQSGQDDPNRTISSLSKISSRPEHHSRPALRSASNKITTIKFIFLFTTAYRLPSLASGRFALQPFDPQEVGQLNSVPLGLECCKYRWVITLRCTNRKSFLRNCSPGDSESLPTWSVNGLASVAPAETGRWTMVDLVDSSSARAVTNPEKRSRNRSMNRSENR